MLSGRGPAGHGAGVFLVAEQVAGSGRLFCLASIAACLYLSVEQPWLGLGLVADETAGAVTAGTPTDEAGGLGVTSIGGIALETTDLIEDPDTLGSDAARDRFMQRQEALHRALAAGSVAVVFTDGSARVMAPQARPLSSLPPSFWVQVLSGAAGFMIGAWVWCFKPRERAPGFFFLSGLGLMLSAHAAAIYSSRELALAPELFLPLSKLNAIGASLFGIAMVGLFFNYPARLFGRSLRLGALGLLALAHLVALLGLVPDSRTAVYGIILVDMLLILVSIGGQVRATRGDPSGARHCAGSACRCWWERSASPPSSARRSCSAACRS